MPGSVAVSHSQMWSKGSLATTEAPDQTVVSGPVNTSRKAAGSMFWSVSQYSATFSTTVPVCSPVGTMSIIGMNPQSWLLIARRCVSWR